MVELVFAGEPPGSRRRFAVGIAFVVGLYATVGIVVSWRGQSASTWSTEMAARIHDLISAERAVEVSPPPKAAPATPIAETAPQRPTTVRPRTRSAVASAPSKPAPPAQAGKIAASRTDPVDFTGMAFVVGSGSGYAGGITATSGTGHKPGTSAGPVDPHPAGGSRAPNLARPVSLDEAAWTCPWPTEADAQRIDEQTVVIRAQVHADGRVDSVDVLSDPGFGFAEAARACALRTRFNPARDALGERTAAASPPIRVHFFR